MGKYESRRRSIGCWPAPRPPNWDLERDVFVYGAIVDATRTKQARVQKQEYPAGGLNSLGQIILVDSVILSYSNITTTVYSEPAG